MGVFNESPFARTGTQFYKRGEEKTLKLKEAMKDKVTIEAPEGYAIDQEKSTSEVIRFKKIEANKKPMSFKELNRVEGFYINSDAIIRSANCSVDDTIMNVWPTKQLAEAALALSQLLQLRDAWNEMTQEDYVLDGVTQWYAIGNNKNQIDYAECDIVNYSLRFKSEQLRNDFIVQFRTLIETALPLI
jgi:hypothetical protein